jgi:hypothetical protein
MQHKAITVHAFAVTAFAQFGITRKGLQCGLLQDPSLANDKTAIAIPQALISNNLNACLHLYVTLLLPDKLKHVVL